MKTFIVCKTDSIKKNAEQGFPSFRSLKEAKKKAKEIGGKVYRIAADTEDRKPSFSMHLVASDSGLQEVYALERERREARREEYWKKKDKDREEASALAAAKQKEWLELHPPFPCTCCALPVRGEGELPFCGTCKDQEKERVRQEEYKIRQKCPCGRLPIARVYFDGRQWLPMPAGVRLCTACFLPTLKDKQ